MESRLQKHSLPLLKLQYKCGYQQCFSDMSSSWGGMGGASGGANGGENSTERKTLDCLEKCEAPVAEFAKAVEQKVLIVTSELCSRW